MIICSDRVFAAICVFHPFVLLSRQSYSTVQKSSTGGPLQTKKWVRKSLLVTFSNGESLSLTPEEICPITSL